MLTGRYPFEQECWTNDDYLRSDARDVAAQPRAPRATGPVLAGRLHSMGPDQLHGYARAHGRRSQPELGRRAAPRPRRARQGQRSVAREPRPLGHRPVGVPGEGRRKPPRRRAITCARSAQRSATATSTPFCLTVGFLLPHPPYVAWREDYERFAGRVPPPAHRRAAVAAARVGSVVAREPRHRRRRRRARARARAPRTTRSSTAWTR